jgi:hypothetical protein
VHTGNVIFGPKFGDLQNHREVIAAHGFLYRADRDLSGAVIASLSRAFRFQPGCRQERRDLRVEFSVPIRDHVSIGTAAEMPPAVAAQSTAP